MSADSSVHGLPEWPPGRRAHAVECGWDRSESGQREQADPRQHRLVHGHLEIVRLLLTLPGLDITTEDKWGNTPEASARKQGHTAIASLLREHASAAAAAPAE